jgi:hypothetical protein
MIAQKTISGLDVPRLSGEVEEFSLLLPTWQIMALAEMAELEGLTVAQYMRHLVNQAVMPATRARFQSA